jgi:type I restriction enzyme S subunit
MNKRTEYKLSDLMKIKYGKDHKHLSDGSYPLYGSGGIMRYVEKPLYDDESILIPRKGTLSNLFYLDQPFWSVDTMFYSIINKDLVIPKYLFYTLQTFDLASLNVGSAVPSLTTEVLNEVLVSIPDLPKQTDIAEILSSLDDKIELNNKINQELENLAQTLFKRWFVDFEFPNENGEPYQSSGGEMVDSELGEIPKGWEVKTFADVASVIDCLHSKKPQILESPTGYRYIQLSNIKDNGLMDLSNQYWITKEDYEKWISRIEVREGDFVITNVGRSGAVSRIPSDVRAAIGRNMTAIRLNEDFNFIGYFSTLVVSDFMKNEITSKLDSGTILDALNVKNIPKLRFVLPAKINTIQVFEDVVKILWEKMEMNIKENNYLKSIRDTLLPKLISGELEVKQVLSQTT